MNDRFENLETKLAFQEDLIQKLDDALGSQQQQIIEMQNQITRVVEHLKSMENSLPDEPEPPPPHY